MCNTKITGLKHSFLKILVCLFIFLTNNSCEQSTEIEHDTKNKMYVYSNSGNTFYLVDYKNYNVVKEIQLAKADTVSYDGMQISTNRDYLFFGAQGKFPNPPSGFAIYNIEKDNLANLFFTELNYGVGYFISANDKSEPGLVYVHFRDYGTYSIDLFERKVKEFISNEHDFVLDKRIYNSPDGKWTVVKKNWEGDIYGGYTELEFYTKSSGLNDLQFVLNRGNKDSLRVYDWVFLNNDKLLIIYLPGSTRGVQASIGYYDLQKGKLNGSPLKFPWSLSGYYLDYSTNRNEVYVIGSNGHFYVIDPDTYSFKDTINLSIGGEQSPIVISPDDNFAFVAYPGSNSIYVIDLNNRKVIKTISVKEPYNMIIP